MKQTYIEWLAEIEEEVIGAKESALIDNKSTIYMDGFLKAIEMCRLHYLLALNLETLKKQIYGEDE